jgi:hypothetical protein
VPRYEYLIILYTWETNWGEIRSLPAETRPAQTWAETLWVWRPGATEAEKRTGDDDLLRVLNELGRDGWALTTSTVLDTTAPPGARYGWFDFAIPIRARHILMREVPG